MIAPGIIEEAILGRVIVYGSLPPGGRDLDLLVGSERERRAIAQSLVETGFVRRENEWARFACCSVEIVELTNASNWDLPADTLSALFEEAQEVAGFHKIVRPCPHHTLLILARRVACGDGMLGEKLRARLHQALTEDPHAWDRARASAPSWSANKAVGSLEKIWRTGEELSAFERAAARRERREGGEQHHGQLRDRLRSTASRVPRPRRGVVVALSGLDGAGKSLQATALKETMERLGYRATVVRTRIAWEDSLWSIAGPVRRALRPLMRLLSIVRPPPPPTPRPIARERSSERDSDAADPEQTLTPDLVRSVREASPLLTELWTLIITLANASSQWKLMRRCLMRGEVVISDRYTLDSIVELGYSYGRQRRLCAARQGLSLLLPTPVRAYFLDVSPQTALERKGEWGIAWLSEHRDLYLQECPRLHVCVLDGEQSREDICAQIAREVWLSGI